MMRGKKRVERSRANSLENRTFARISSAAPINIIMTDHDWKAAVWQQKSAHRKKGERITLGETFTHVPCPLIDGNSECCRRRSRTGAAAFFWRARMLIWFYSYHHQLISSPSSSTSKKHGEFFACSLCRIVHSWEHRNVMCSAHLHNLFRLVEQQQQIRRRRRVEGKMPGRRKKEARALVQKWDFHRVKRATIFTVVIAINNFSSHLIIIIKSGGSSCANAK